MSRKSSFFIAATPLVLLLGCSGTTSVGGGAQASGGATSAASTDASGGSAQGGAVSTGGAAATGGVIALGEQGAGGLPTTGGAPGTGGVALTGGAAPSGGSQSTAAATGGRFATGGSRATTGTGGSLTTGGTATTGSSTGGATSIDGSCSRTIGSCSAPTVNIASVTLNSAAQAAAGASDTANLPLAIAAMPSGGSRLAWLGTDNNVHIAELDCSDQLVGTPFTIPGIDLQDIYADDSGGVVLLTRNATNGGTDNCGGGTLCGGTSSPCRTMWLVRFTSAGTVSWETEVTNLSSTQAGYQNGAHFVWWYQHHGRIAHDGTNYAAYHGTALTVNNGSCVDIHEGDSMQVVGPTGTLLTGHNSFDWGCSHSWTARVVWDPRINTFMSVCATDNNCRISHSPHYTTVATSTCDGNLFNGDIVNSTTAGYWDAWANGGNIALQHFTTSGSDTAVTGVAANLHPHLVTYGSTHMLLAWGSGATVTAQVRDSGATGAQVGANFTIAVNEQPYQAWKSYADGSVAYPGYNTSTSVKIARVMPCQ